MDSTQERVAITAIVTAYDRVEQTIETVNRIAACRPSPDEILIHVDGGQHFLADTLRDKCEEAEIFVTDQKIGPGGARNKLLRIAANELVASFDDDSFPIDGDYFQRAHLLAEKYIDASIFSASIFHRGEPVPTIGESAYWVADFGGGGCVYRRSHFLTTSGYVPLPTAYGMEEVDIALRLHDSGHRVLRSQQLRVFHDTRLLHHSNTNITAASIANIALLTYLRYPIVFWPLGLAQTVNRIHWLLRNRRFRGIVLGILFIPILIAKHWNLRAPVAVGSVRSFLSLRGMPLPA